MTKYALFVLHFFVIQLFGQNLVPNGGFESIKNCPNGLKQLNKAKYWDVSNGGSPELYHKCGFLPEIQPFEGEGMAGIILLAKYSSSAEYLQIELSDSLEKDKSYCFQFNIRAKEDNPFNINKIGVKFSKSKLRKKSWDPFILTPSYSYQEIVDNTESWLLVNTLYKAKGGERFLTIGNFFERYHLEIAKGKNPSTRDYAYYYIDNIALFESRYNCNISVTELNEEIQSEKVKNCTLYFDKDDWRLKDSEIKKLEDYLGQYSGELKWIELRGHTDSDASEAYNIILSKKRVEATEEFVVANYIHKTKMLWYGEKKIIVENDSEENMAKNRRVELNIIE